MSVSVDKMEVEVGQSAHRLAVDGWNSVGQARNAARGLVEWAIGLFAGVMHFNRNVNDIPTSNPLDVGNRMNLLVDSKFRRLPDRPRASAPRAPGGRLGGNTVGLGQGFSKVHRAHRVAPTGVAGVAFPIDLSEYLAVAPLIGWGMSGGPQVGAMFRLHGEVVADRSVGIAMGPTYGGANWPAFEGYTSWRAAVSLSAEFEIERRLSSGLRFRFFMGASVRPGGYACTLWGGTPSATWPCDSTDWHPYVGFSGGYGR